MIYEYVFLLLYDDMAALLALGSGRQKKRIHDTALTY